MRTRSAFALAAWAALAASARGAAKGPGPEPEPDAKPRRVIPKVVLVVECARQADVEAARDFAAYMTRAVPVKVADGDVVDTRGRPVGGGIIDGRGNAAAGSTLDADGMVTPIHCAFEFSASANLAEAQLAATRGKALAIAHVKIVRREPAARGGNPVMMANCSVYLPETVKDKKGKTWRLEKTKVLGEQHALLLEPIAIPDNPGDPSDFMATRLGVTRLVHNAAVSIAAPGLRRAPKKGERLKVRITNNARHAVVRVDMTVTLAGSMAVYSYRDGHIPPGGNAVAEVEALCAIGPEYERAVPDRPAQVVNVQFAEAEAEQASGRGSK